MTAHGDPTVVYDGLSTRGPFTFEDLASITFDRIAELGLSFFEVGEKNVVFVDSETGAGVTISDILADVSIDVVRDYEIHPLQGVTYDIGDWEAVGGMPSQVGMRMRAVSSCRVSITPSSTSGHTPLSRAVTWSGAATVCRYLPDASRISSTGVWSPSYTLRGTGSVSTAGWAPGYKEPWMRILDDYPQGGRFADFASIEQGQRMVYAGLNGTKMDGFAAHSVILTGFFSPPTSTAQRLILQELSMTAKDAAGVSYPRIALDSKGRIVVLVSRVTVTKTWDAKKKKQVLVRRIVDTSAGALDSGINGGAASVIGVTWLFGGKGVHLCTISSSGGRTTTKSATITLGASFARCLTTGNGSRLSIGSTSAVNGTRGAAMDLYELTHIGVRSSSASGIDRLRTACGTLHSIYKGGGFDVA